MCPPSAGRRRHGLAPATVPIVPNSHAAVSSPLHAPAAVVTFPDAAASNFIRGCARCGCLRARHDRVGWHPGQKGSSAFFVATTSARAVAAGVAGVAGLLRCSASRTASSACSPHECPHKHSDQRCSPHGRWRCGPRRNAPAGSNLQRPGVDELDGRERPFHAPRLAARSLPHGSLPARV